MTADLQSVPLFQYPFYFLRHGESESNVEGTIAGSRDVALTPRGHRQALSAAEMVRNKGIAAVYSSPLRRAGETAEHVANALEVPLTFIPDLAERSWGELEGHKVTLIRPGVTPPGGEQSYAFRQRVLRGLAQVQPHGGDVLIVAHAWVFGVLCDVLGVAEAETRVANAQPLRFVPPARDEVAWQLELIDRRRL